MKKTFSFLLLSVTLILFSCSGTQQPAFVQVAPEKLGMSSERLQDLSGVFQDYVDKGELSGSVILVARKGQIAYYEAVGNIDVEQSLPMGKDAIFRIASQTKAVVSTGIMILQEEGKLLISDPVGKYIPEFRETSVAVAREDGSYDVVKAERPVTIRDLLTHTAGIGYGSGVARDIWKEAGIQGWYFADRDEPVLDVVKRMAALPFDAQPGERFVYGYNTDILGAVIEEVSGQALDVFLKEKILDPLGMEDSHFFLPEEKAERLAVVYSAGKDGLERAPDPGKMVGQGDYLKGPRMCFSGGAGLLSTAMDYARFLQMMLNGGELDGQRILSRKTVELMTVDHIKTIKHPKTDGTGFGLGFSVLEDLGTRGTPGSVGEFGWGGAYHSVYWVDPVEELVVVYFTQLIPSGGLDDHSKLRSLVYQSITD